MKSLEVSGALGITRLSAASVTSRAAVTAAGNRLTVMALLGCVRYFCAVDSDMALTDAH
jgi:hypothetical protein